MNIILCGYKTSGKTTLAKAYSQRYPSAYIDTDELICQTFKSLHGVDKTVADIYSELGEQAFRRFESKVLKTMRCTNETLIATGAGAVLDPDNVDYLKSLGRIVYLNVNKALLTQRLLALKTRPRFMQAGDTEAAIRQYLNSRDLIYHAVADQIIQINEQPIEVLLEILYQYRQGL